MASIAQGGIPAGFGQDGTNGDHPRHNYIERNLCHELGIWEKQSSFYTTFKSGRNTVEGNLVWNGPRAHVNVNDGFMGGNLFDRNVRGRVRWAWVGEMKLR